METTIHNVETGEIVVRQMNAAEKKNLENALAETEALKTQLQERARAKAELLEKLGLTADEAALLLS